MAYYGHQPEQVQAQIRSMRGETIDLSLPSTCTVGDLRSFLIDEYQYSPKTRLLFNGMVTNDDSCVNTYPYGSLLIATPAEGSWQPQTAEQRSVQSRLPLPTHQQQSQQRAQQQQQMPRRQSSGRLPAQQPRSPRQPSVQNQAQQAARPTPSPRSQKPQQAQPGSRTPTVQRSNQQQPADAGAAAVAIPPQQHRSEALASRFNNATATDARSQSGRDSTPPSQPSSARLDNFSRNATGAPYGDTPASPQPGAGVSTFSSSASSAPAVPAHNQQHHSTNSTAVDGAGGGNSSTGSRSTPAPSAAPLEHSQPQQRSAPTPKPAGGQPPTSKTPGPEGVTEELNHIQALTFFVECHIPDMNKIVHLEVSGDASVADLMLAIVAAVPEVAGGAKVVYKGKVLPQTPQSKLFNFGMRSDCRVFVASGQYANPDTIVLIEIEEEVKAIEKDMKKPLTELERKGYYENLMRILFRTDGLQELEDEWRQKRKDMVKAITSLQDRLHIEEDQ